MVELLHEDCAKLSDSKGDSHVDVLPLALHPCMDRNIHSVIHDDVKKLQKELEKSGLGWA